LRGYRLRLRFDLLPWAAGLCRGPWCRPSRPISLPDLRGWCRRTRGPGRRCMLGVVRSRCVGGAWMRSARGGCHGGQPPTQLLVATTGRGRARLSGPGNRKAGHRSGSAVRFRSLERRLSPLFSGPASESHGHVCGAAGKPRPAAVTAWSVSSGRSGGDGHVGPVARGCAGQGREIPPIPVDHQAQVPTSRRSGAASRGLAPRCATAPCRSRSYDGTWRRGIGHGSSTADYTSTRTISQVPHSVIVAGESPWHFVLHVNGVHRVPEYR